MFGLYEMQTTKHCRLVDEITYKKAAEATDAATQSAVLGPFFRHDAPHRKNGETITFNTPDNGEIVYMHGTVRCAKTNKPLANASVDVWLASTNGRSADSHKDSNV